MASKKISELPAFTPPVDANTLVPVVQGGVTKKANISALKPSTLPMTTEFDATSPSAPTTGLTLYAAAKAAAPRPSWNAPSNITTAVQSMLATNKIALWSAQGNVTGAHTAGAIGLIGASSFPFGATPVARTVVATGSDLLAAKRLGYVAASSGNSGVHNGTMQFGLKSGFEYICRFGRSSAGTSNALSGIHIGLRQTTDTASMAFTDNNYGCIGFRQDGQTAPFLYFNNGAAWYSVVGAPLSNISTTSINDAIYELRIFCKANATQIDLRFENITTGVVETRTITSQLPGPNILFNPMACVTNSKAIDLISYYVETDI